MFPHLKGLVALPVVAFAFFSSMAEAAKIVSVTSKTSTLSLGKRFEARIDVVGAHENPFDPSEILVDALISTPGGIVHRVPTFWNQDTVHTLHEGKEKVTVHGEGAFHVRYAPMVLGRHEVSFIAEDRNGKDVSASTVFEVVSGDERGFVRRDHSDPFALAFEDGTPYVPVGANICWSISPKGSYDMEAYLLSLAQAGGTWSRLWLTHYGVGWTLEWGEDHPSGEYVGLGRYSLEAASRLDRVFEVAESKGIGIQFVLWQHSQFETDHWSSWHENPYNEVLGGPASSSKDFFANPIAIELSQRRLRYLVARYSAYRSLFAWEVMNELDGVHAPYHLVKQWNEDRARELRTLDPHEHLITTSVMIRPSLAPSDVWDSDAYDIVQSHAYGGAFWSSIPKDAGVLRTQGRPFLFAEFGLDYRGKYQDGDPDGIHLMEGSWIALASGFWGGAMSWWWDTYLRPQDLWHTQTGIAAFVRSVDLRGMHEPLGEEVEADAGNQHLEVIGRKGSSGAMLYVRHPSARWEIAKDSGFPLVEGARVHLPCSTSGCYIRAYDPFSGQPLGGEVIGRGEADGWTWVALPTFSGAVALKVGEAWLVPGQLNPTRSEGGCCGVVRAKPSGKLPWAVLSAVVLAFFMRWRPW